MDAGNIARFLNLVGCRKVRIASRVVRATCPFEHLHSGGMDKNPSFGVLIDDSEWSGWRCQGCNKKGGSLGQIVRILDQLRRSKIPREEFLTDYGTKILYRFVWEHETWRKGPKAKPEASSIKSWRGQPDLDDIYATPEQIVPPPRVLPILPEAFLTDYFALPVGDGLKYLHRRGFTDETIAVWEIRWHASQQRVAFPVRNREGKLVGISGRGIHEAQRPKYLHSDGFKSQYFLFGEDKVVPGGTGILVEGQPDVIALWQYGYRNMVAIFGSFLNPDQADKVVELFTDVVVLTDSDKGGKDAATQIVGALGERIPARVREIPSDLNDPGEFVKKKIAKEQVIEIVGLAPAC